MEQVYFFRMWLVLILSGALHGLVLLPVLLSFFGGQGYALSTDDDAWMGRVMGSRYEGRIFRKLCTCSWQASLADQVLPQLGRTTTRTAELVTFKS